MIDPAFLADLDQFAESLDRTVQSVYQGRQESPEVGEGQTFSDHRQYTPGDDIRLVDWKVLARTGEVYIKRFEAERELMLHVLLDASASMDVGDRDAGTHKFEFGAKLALGVCYIAAETHNDFRLSTFDETFTRLDRGTSNRKELLRLLNRLNDTDPTGESGFEGALRSYASTISSRSLVVVVSDFLADPEEIRTGLQALGEHDTVAAQVVAPEEVDLPVGGDTIFEDIETGRSLRTYFGGRLERTYTERLQSHFDAVQARCRQTGTAHGRYDTDADFFDSFATLWLALRSD